MLDTMEEEKEKEYLNNIRNIFGFCRRKRLRFKKFLVYNVIGKGQVIII